MENIGKITNIEKPKELSPTEEKKNSVDQFSKTEKIVAKLVLEGYSDVEIGKKLFNSDRTIGTHRGSIQKKLGVNNSVKMVTALIDELKSEENIKSLGFSLEDIKKEIEENDLELKSLVEDIKLSERENETLLLLAKGLTSEEIAKTIGISKRTVDCYRNSLMSKFNCNNATKLIIRAYLYGFLNLP